MRKFRTKIWTVPIFNAEGPFAHFNALLAFSTVNASFLLSSIHVSVYSFRIYVDSPLASGFVCYYWTTPLLAESWGNFNSISIRINCFSTCYYSEFGDFHGIRVWICHCDDLDKRSDTQTCVFCTNTCWLQPVFSAGSGASQIRNSDQRIELSFS